MANIEKSATGFFNCAILKLYLSDVELEMLEAYRARCKERLVKNPNCTMTEDMDYTLDDVVMYILGEVLSGRGRYLDIYNGYAFDQ